MSIAQKNKKKHKTRLRPSSHEKKSTHSDNPIILQEKHGMHRAAPRLVHDGEPARAAMSKKEMEERGKRRRG
jgi:hypothetical protein